MVIWFNVKKARNFLFRNGFVYTVRTKKRKTGKDVLMFDGFKKRGYVFVEFVKEIENESELKNFMRFSGFDSVEEWLSAVQNINRNNKNKKYYLYKATLLRWNNDAGARKTNRKSLRETRRV